MKGKKLNKVGIDVGSKELVVKIERNGELQSNVAVFTNDKSGHKKLVKYITKNKARAQVCMEATGVYHFELALLLSKTEGVEVMVVNPKAIKHFGIASMKRCKTDPIDASTILEYMKCMPFCAWEAPKRECLELQAITRRIYQMKTEITRETSRGHACDYSEVRGGIINNDIEVNIRHLKKRIEILEKRALEVIQASEGLKKRYELLITIKGVAKRSAIQLLSELACLPNDMRAEQWVAYAGLDPRAMESGTSVNKPRRISKAGNKYLRTALYMPSWVAVQSESHVKGFYEKLIRAGKAPLQAIVAVMRKLLHAIWGMLNTGKAWDGSRFYSGPIESK